MSDLYRIATALAVLTLCGCATLSKSECQTGDWYSIGVRDGANGQTEDRFLENAKACAARGMPADRERWMQGREHGLERYCTAPHGYQVGAAGENYRGVCLGPVEGEFMRGFQLGHQLAEARDRHSHWDHEIHEIQQRLDRAKADDKHDGDHGDHAGKKADYEPLTDDERVALGVRLGIAIVKRDEAAGDMAAIEERSRQLH